MNRTRKGIFGFVAYLVGFGRILILLLDSFVRIPTWIANCKDDVDFKAIILAE